MAMGRGGEEEERSENLSDVFAIHTRGWDSLFLKSGGIDRMD
jgi:hypothetical protein